MLLEQILIIVVLYKPSDNDLKQVIGNIKSNFLVLIIDNSEQSHIHHFDRFLNVVYKHFKQNIGLSDAYNYGIDFCLANQKKFMWIMDQDSDFSHTPIQDLDHIILTNQIELIGCAILGLRPVSSMEELKVKWSQDFTWDEVLLSSGSIINVEIAKRLKGFDSRIFIDTVDCEYAFRVMQNGYKILRINNLTFVHNIGTPTNLRYADMCLMSYKHSPLRRYYMVRNNLLMNEIYSNSDNQYIKNTLQYSMKTWVFEQLRLINYEDNRLLKYYYCLLGKFHYNTKVFGQIPEHFLVYSNQDVVDALLQNRDLCRFFIEYLVAVESMVNSEIKLLNDVINRSSFDSLKHKIPPTSWFKRIKQLYCKFVKQILPQKNPLSPK